MSIRFTNVDIDFSLDNQEILKRWINEIISFHQKKTGNISYQFCSDDYIHDVNVSFLNHDTLTDIITFDRVVGTNISGDILISVDRVGDNANIFEVPFKNELHRVIIHGVLHLLGFKDKTESDATTMRAKENEALSKLDLIIDDNVSRGTI